MRRGLGAPGLVGLLLAVGLGVPTPLAAQQDCTLLCTPEVAIEPGIAIEPVFESPRVAELREGVAVDTAREPTSTEFEITLAVGIPTEIPRTELGFDVTWTPFVETDENPFTGRTAEEVEADAFRENVIEFAPEVSVTLLTPEETAGWSEVALSVSDDISPAETPEDNWLRGLEVEGALDYLATGVPQAGDEVPEGETRFLDDGARWGVSVVGIVPLAPLHP